MRTGVGTDRYDLGLVVRESGDGLGGYLEYSTGLCDGGTAERMARTYDRLLAEIAGQPGAALAELRERAQATASGLTAKKAPPAGRRAGEPAPPEDGGCEPPPAGLTPGHRHRRSTHGPSARTRTRATARPSAPGQAHRAHERERSGQ
ncbi:hypothetical protein [Streptomyces sp. NL15-2K]|uniref:hypothetical protein n=1 Tax=Streptomyces sp. NL15-2K TaxID=376149 RepID=UPI00209C4EA9|nr:MULTISPECIES: hypothetical protein [Actinomycetes]WKX06490.1 hypothetical protein Q4V64_02890 [Kutzneria buriramensis]